MDEPSRSERGATRVPGTSTSTAADPPLPTETPLKRSELTRRLAQMEGFPRPEARLEQVPTPPEEASALLWEALSRGDLQGRRVADLGAGTGTLAIGAALLGAADVVAVEMDPSALEVGRRNSLRAGARVEWRQQELMEAGSGSLGLEAETVVMNPPFGAQRKHADRPFLEAAVAALPASGGGAIYLLANAASQAFIERWSIARHLTIEEHRRSRWLLPPTFSHHREARGRVDVDRWILRRR